MLCLFCKGDMKEAITTFTVDVDDRVIVIRNVPCRRCTQCGEATFSDDVARQLESMVTAMRQSPAKISVADYAMAA